MEKKHILGLTEITKYDHFEVCNYILYYSNIQQVYEKEERYVYK